MIHPTRNLSSTNVHINEIKQTSTTNKPMRKSYITTTNTSRKLSDKTPITDSNIHAAVHFWCRNSKKATEKFGHISQWDVSNVKNMNKLFKGKKSFVDDISSWDVSKVTNMRSMFRGATSFNGDLSSWDVSSATNMFSMFQGATSFNSDISNWDLSSVQKLSKILYGATSFGKTLCWNVDYREVNMVSMFTGTNNAGLAKEAYPHCLPLTKITGSYLMLKSTKKPLGTNIQLCLESDNSSVTLSKCNSSNMKQRWRMDDVGRIHSWLQPKKCMRRQIDDDGVGDGIIVMSVCRNSPEFLFTTSMVPRSTSVMYYIKLVADVSLVIATPFKPNIGDSLVLETNRESKNEQWFVVMP